MPVDSSPRVKWPWLLGACCPRSRRCHRRPPCPSERLASLRRLDAEGAGRPAGSTLAGRPIERHPGRLVGDVFALRLRDRRPIRATSSLEGGTRSSNWCPSWSALWHGRLWPRAVVLPQVQLRPGPRAERLRRWLGRLNRPPLPGRGSGSPEPSPTLQLEDLVIESAEGQARAAEQPGSGRRG